MILVFGSVNIDLVARVPSIPRPGETVLSTGYETLFGGKGANQAVAAARASWGAGTEVAIAARVGSDEFGRAAVANLAASGVSAACVTAGPEPTGCAFIAVEDSGENAITVASGANSALTSASLKHKFTAADILVLQIEVPFAESLLAATRARAAGAQVIWNFAPAPAGFGREELLSLLIATDILVVNEQEAVAAARILGAAPESAEEAAGAIADGRRLTAVLTAGPRGAIAFMADSIRHSAPALAIQPVDTTGAGDTFVGVLAAEIAQGRDLPGALQRACIAASLACTKAGAQAGMPDRAELEAACSAST
jgi:ribokinase